MASGPVTVANRTNALRTVDILQRNILGVGLRRLAMDRLPVQTTDRAARQIVARVQGSRIHRGSQTIPAWGRSDRAAGPAGQPPLAFTRTAAPRRRQRPVDESALRRFKVQALRSASIRAAASFKKRASPDRRRQTCPRAALQRTERKCSAGSRDRLPASADRCWRPSSSHFSSTFNAFSESSLTDLPAHCECAAQAAQCHAAPDSPYHNVSPAPPPE